MHVYMYACVHFVSIPSLHRLIFVLLSPHRPSCSEISHSKSALYPHIRRLLLRPSPLSTRYYRCKPLTLKGPR